MTESKPCEDCERGRKRGEIEDKIAQEIVDGMVNR